MMMQGLANVKLNYILCPDFNITDRNINQQLQLNFNELVIMTSVVLHDIYIYIYIYMFALHI
jgi:hypothetical protein